jgi:hypothetical protein
MPATPSHFRRPRVVNHTIDFFGVEVKFVYDANKLRDSWINEWAAIEQKSDGGKLNEMLDDLILGWDIRNDDGTEYPKSTETIGELFTIPDKSIILRELMLALNPTEDEKGGSSEPSSTLSTDSTAPAETSPNGSETSQSQTVSASPSVT